MELTEELVEQIANNVKDGNFPNIAAVQAGVPQVLFSQWIDKGNAELISLQQGNELNPDNAIYVHLFTELEHAEAVAEGRAVSFWQNFVSENWVAAKEFLARRYPKRWSSSPTPEQ